MNILTKIVNLFFTSRYREIERFRQNPVEVQSEQLDYLLRMGRKTEFGREHGLEGVSSLEQFQNAVPITDYESFFPYIDKQRRGEKSIIWPNLIKWYAKSSGTTDAKSKFIPVSREGLRNGHMKGPVDVAALIAHIYPNTKVFSGRMLTLGGSKKVEPEGDAAFSGDLSAILIENTPNFVRNRRVPSPEIALIPDFEEKVRKIAESTIDMNIASFAGVPSWNLVMMNKILEISGKDNLLEIWPNLELFIHGGINFSPYKEQYKAIIPSSEMKYMETYNASEGFFSIADDPTRGDMLLMLDYETFFEFIPTKSLHDPSTAVPIEGVEEGVNYAMIITTSNGLWRYMIGDTVMFTSTYPYRIKITGRTKHFINVFGEEVVIENAESAILAACEATGAEITEFSVAPIYMDGNKKGAHEWVIEFSEAPDSLDKFRETLDKTLQSLNSDYEAKRFKETTLVEPKISVVPQGTFIRWMKSRDKIGGQNKVPRLYNDRTFVDQLLKIAD